MVGTAVGAVVGAVVGDVVALHSKSSKTGRGERQRTNIFTGSCPQVVHSS